MAHITKYKHSQVGGNLLSHMERNRGDRSRYGNESIDHSRTHLNYDLSEAHCWKDSYIKGYEVGEDYRRKWEALLKVQRRKIRPDAVGLGAVIVTLPERYRDSPPYQIAEFFEQTYSFLHEMFGSRDNEIYACVHMDETTPHIHYGFIPVDENRQISAKRVLDRSTFQHFHENLDKHLQKSLRWYEGGILMDTLTEPKKEYISIDKLKDQPKLYRDVRENNNVLNDALRSARKGKPLKLNRRQAMALRDQQEKATSFAWTLEASEDVARQRFGLDYREKQLDARQDVIDKREMAANDRWNRALAKEKELSSAMKEKDERLSRLEEENRTLKEQLKPLYELREDMIERLAKNPEEMNTETRSEKTDAALLILRKSKLVIKREEVEKKRKETRERQKGTNHGLSR